jgi:3-oxoisoapionate decarboxylase
MSTAWCSLWMVATLLGRATNADQHPPVPPAPSASGRGSAGPLGADPYQPRGPRRRQVQIGLDSFSFHRWFGEANEWEWPLDERWTTHELLDHVETLGVDVLSLQTIHLDDRSPASLTRLGRELAAAGLECILAWGHRSGLEDGRSAEKLRDALGAMEMARTLGCQVMRVVCGDQYSWNNDPAVRRERLDGLRKPLAAIARRAEELNLVIAVENHADSTAAEIAGLVGSVDPVHLGTCFDVGNAARVGEDVEEAATATLPYCVMSHLRDLRIQDASRGDPTDWWPCVALGEGDLPIGSVLELIVRSPRASALLVETSNVLPGSFEPELVEASLEYLRNWLARSAPGTG